MLSKNKVSCQFLCVPINYDGDDYSLTTIVGNTLRFECLNGEAAGIRTPDILNTISKKVED